MRLKETLKDKRFAIVVAAFLATFVLIGALGIRDGDSEPLLEEPRPQARLGRVNADCPARQAPGHVQEAFVEFGDPSQLGLVDLFETPSLGDDVEPAQCLDGAIDRKPRSVCHVES